MLCMLMMTACSEHIETDDWQATTGQEGNVKLVVGLDAILPTTRTFTDSEISIDVIQSYWLLFYKKEGDTYKLVKRQDGTANTALKVETTVSLDPGIYHAYVVANIDVANIDDSKIPVVGDEESALFNIQLGWVNGDISKNQTMFGFFTKADDTPGNDLVTDLDNSIDEAVNQYGLHKVNPTAHKAPEIIIESTTIQAKLTAKLYRMAAMVSLHFDTWDLYPGVELTLQSVKLYNIPNKYCLWKESAADGPDEVAIDEVIDIGFKQKTSNSIVHEYESGAALHGNTKNIYTLNKYFYMPENRQGTVETTSLNDKTAGADKAKEYATYIEVVAKHKINDTNERTVTYRYALGEDSYGDNNEIVYNNYNVTRNRHYKVYLTLKGYGLSSAATWRTELGTETFTPFVEITGSKIRLVDYNGKTVNATSWSVENTNDWLHLRKTAKIDKTNDKAGDNLKRAVGISDGTGNVEFYYHALIKAHKDNQTFYADTDLSGTITLKYKITTDVEEVTKTIDLKRFGLTQYNFGSSWIVPNLQYIEPSGSGKEPVYYNVCVDENPWINNNEYKFTLYNGIKNPDDMTVFTNNMQLRWFGPYREKRKDYDADKGEVTFTFYSDARLNGYYTFDISVPGYMPMPVTILKNAPLTIKDPVAEAFFENGNIKNIPDITDTKFKLVKDAGDTGSQYVTSVAPYIPSIIVDKNETKTTTPYPYCFNIKNNNTYIEFTISEKQTLNVVGRGRYESGNGYVILKVASDTETPVQNVSMPSSNHIRNYTTTLDAGTYRIKKTSGEIYLHYLALN